ncbi:Enoyl-CoA hydratase/isomerase [Sphingobium chlorophenolicum L-1]|uniref:Enoyl-CoA hydratase/isomerase n=1 Tax=Sphingobium chlorophenolicum L-1 TaxID=690566 RepID=F6F3H2_SPHCR|nr:crotonase/enoyl-CoA hydratase family protein [Sphingobium chlorophenolicum]AEG50984.1 Enoyl-CoA hydratase/isomerase [Sphingobium chlorophenolicum L-1]
MSYETIDYAVADRIATLTLNRPDRLNAYTRKMMEEMIDAFDRIDADDDVRAVVVTGAGRAFCAGADLEGGTSTFDLAKAEDSPVRADGSLDYSKQSARDSGGLLTLRIHRCLKPVIAAINGPAVGIGATMTLPMDIRLASENARIGFVFARRGIVPEGASSFFLPRLVGMAQALEWCFSGRVFSAAEAKEGGLVKTVLPADELLPAAYALAREIAENTSPVSVALIRQMMWRGAGMTDPMQAHRIDSRGILSRGRSRDVAEGVTAFLEKRPPDFPDRVSADMPDYFPWWEEPDYH